MRNRLPAAAQVVRKIYVEALISRSENPADFDTNIAYLHTLVEINRLREISLNEKTIEERSALNLSFDAALYNDKDTAQLRSREFAKEPRITSLDEKSELQPDLKSSPNLYKQKRAPVVKQCYVINFRDGSSMRFDHMQLQHAQAKAQLQAEFDAKMRALAPQQQPVYAPH